MTDHQDLLDGDLAHPAVDLSKVTILEDGVALKKIKELVKSIRENEDSIRDDCGSPVSCGNESMESENDIILSRVKLVSIYRGELAKLIAKACDNSRN
jgi:hypothetical protein